MICTIFRRTHTLYNAILRIARNFLETSENIKISTHPFYHINLDWFSWEWSKKKIIFLYFASFLSKSVQIHMVHFLVSRKFLAMRNITLYSVYYINFVSINQTNKVSYKSIKNKRLKEISNQIVIQDMKESHRKLSLYTTSFSSCQQNWIK